MAHYSLVTIAKSLAPFVQLLVAQVASQERLREAEYRIQLELQRLDYQHQAFRMALEALLQAEQDRTERFMAVMRELRRSRWRWRSSPEERLALIQLAQAIEMAGPQVTIPGFSLHGDR